MERKMKRFIEKYGRNKVIAAVLGLTAFIAIIGYGIWYTMEENYKSEVLESIGITFVEKPTLEYGTKEKDIDLKKLIKESSGEITYPDKADIDTMKTGKIQLIYKVSAQGYEKEEPVEIEIKDTKKPEIKVKEERVELVKGAEAYDPKSNVESVKDPVDGDIKDYKVEGSVDINTAGEYKITVKAKDKNGNEGKKEFTVVVKEEEVQEPEAGAVSSGYGGNTQGVNSSQNNAGNQNNGGNSGGNSGSNDKPANTCREGVPASNQDTSNGVFPTNVAANDAALKQATTVGDPHRGGGYSIVAVFDECNKVMGYTIAWH